MYQFGVSNTTPNYDDVVATYLRRVTCRSNNISSVEIHYRDLVTTNYYVLFHAEFITTVRNAYP